MHAIQERLLAQVDRDPALGQKSLRQIGKNIGEDSAQKIKHHLTQLEKRGLIAVDRKSGVIRRIKSGKISPASGIIAIPVLGYANCGEAAVVAEERPEEFLRVSSRLLPKTKKIFAVRAIGNSLNRAQIGKGRKSIEEGDYVIVDYDNRNPKDGEYVLSIIGGLANLKKFQFDRKNNQVVLSSESTHHHNPIFIHPEDDYLVGGTIVAVLKAGNSSRA